MKEIMYNEYAKEVLESLSKGAFLNVSNGQQDNTMTIAWGNIGFMWQKPIFTVMVRYSRHTYTMLEQAGEFSVSIPLNVNLKKELGFCGSKSGRDVDKFAEAQLTKLRANRVNAPLVGECELHYECKVVGRCPLTSEMLIPEINEKQYGNNDYHVLYYGEIVGTYLK